ncbi:hypothetical protein [Zavarzinia aquatilis]|uniref:hypothetical protein n=1 Tax=Zavarzinia aquatilis TaxID=2211142 RepID=UPI001403A293|nr:hypothetical protein [Zavarzinia aquatilis]
MGASYRNWRLLAVAGIAAVLAGCMPHGAADFSLGRVPGWFRYLSGDDIKAACEAGGPDVTRFVYNARWTEQVRAYELRPAPYGASIDQWVWGPGTLLAATPAGPDMQAKKAQVGIDRPRLARLAAALAQSDVAGAAPRGRFLRSDTFYWVVASCTAGRFHFNAFQAGDGRFEALSFPQELFAADRTGVAVNMPRPLDLPPLTGRFDDEPRPFTVQVDENGLDVARWD